MNSETSDTTYNYCTNKAAPNGSDLYYATVFGTTKNKTLIFAFHAFLYELNDIIYECSDPGVARIKLNWWQEEIERLFNKQARHPVTQQMQECISFNSHLQSTFDSVIAFFNNFIFIEQPDSLNTILSLYRATTGEVWYQYGHQLDDDQTISLDILREMGAIINFISCLQQPNTYINESRCIIPSLYAGHTRLLDLRVDTIKKHTTQKEVFSPLLVDLKTRLNETYKKLSTKDNTTFQHSLILNRLTYETCDEILENGCHLLDRNISLTPLRKLWIAWRTRYFYQI